MNEQTSKKEPYKVPEIDYPKHIPAVNEITGSRLTTGVPSQAYKDNYDTIFRKKDVKEVDENQDQQ